MTENTGNKFSVGDIVVALAGRDSGKTFVVVGILDGSYVYIADGKSRKADFPKKKKIRHIELAGKAGDGFMQGLNLKNGKFTNSALRKITAAFRENQSQSGNLPINF